MLFLVLVPALSLGRFCVYLPQLAAAAVLILFLSGFLFLLLFLFLFVTASMTEAFALFAQAVSRGSDNRHKRADGNQADPHRQAKAEYRAGEHNQGRLENERNRVAKTKKKIAHPIHFLCLLFLLFLHDPNQNRREKQKKKKKEELKEGKNKQEGQKEEDLSQLPCQDEGEEGEGEKKRKMRELPRDEQGSKEKSKEKREEEEQGEKGGFLPSPVAVAAALLARAVRQPCASDVVAVRTAFPCGAAVPFRREKDDVHDRLSLQLPASRVQSFLGALLEGISSSTQQQRRKMRRTGECLK